jgi:hypothetical protein
MICSSKDRPLSDQISDRQCDAHEDRADVEQHQDLTRLVRRVTEGIGDAEPYFSADRQREHAKDERQQRQERELTEASKDQPYLPTRNRRKPAQQRAFNRHVRIARLGDL